MLPIGLHIAVQGRCLEDIALQMTAADTDCRSQAARRNHPRTCQTTLSPVISDSCYRSNSSHHFKSTFLYFSFFSWKL